MGDAEVEIKLEVPFSESRDSSNLKSSSLHFSFVWLFKESNENVDSKELQEFRRKLET